MAHISLSGSDALTPLASAGARNPILTEAAHGHTGDVVERISIAVPIELVDDARKPAFSLD